MHELFKTLLLISYGIANGFIIGYFEGQMKTRRIEYSISVKFLSYFVIAFFGLPIWIVDKLITYFSKEK